MSKITARLTGQWKELHALLSVGQALPHVRQAMSVATNVNGAVVRREIRDNIRKGTYATNRIANAVLTTKIKRSSKPLVDSGHLFKSVTMVPIDWKSCEVGVLRGDPAANVALLVHEGATVEVTKRMRNMFSMLAEASAGTLDPSRLTGRVQQLFARMPKGWKALKPSTSQIRIPARPYIREVVESQKINTLVGENWLTAASRGIAGLQVTAGHLRRQP